MIVSLTRHKRGASKQGSNPWKEKTHKHIQATYVDKQIPFSSYARNKLKNESGARGNFMPGITRTPVTDGGVSRADHCTDSVDNGKPLS